MTWVALLSAIRIALYTGMAGTAVIKRRWTVWGVFTALVASTYINAFTGLDAIAVECIRTAVAVGLIYITLERK